MTLCFFNLGTGELMVILLVVLLLFGAKRIPELARSLGKGISSFREGMNGVSEQINEKNAKDSE